MQILDDIYNETKRLFIAGSNFAKDDPRVTKFIPILEKMGEKAPVMKKLAEKYATLVNGGQPDALAGAAAFLYAVRATQSETKLSGEAAQTIPSIDKLPETIIPYSRLKPVMEALTLAKQGRFDVVKSAFEEGVFNDFRLFKALVVGLDDKYSEVAAYINDNIILSIGAPIIPYILEQYNPSGKKGDAMRLSLLYELGYENIEQLAVTAVEEGDPLVAVEGIKILGINPENEEYLLTLARDKKAVIREAALIGLMRLDSARGKELLIKTLQSSKYKCAIPGAKACKDPEYTGKLLELIWPYYKKLLEKDLPDKDFVESNLLFIEMFGILENKDDPAVYEFFTIIMKNKYYYMRLKKNKINYNFTGDARGLLCDYLTKCPPDKALKVFEEAATPEIMKTSAKIVVSYFNVAVKIYSPERLFNVFSMYYESGLVAFNQLFDVVSYGKTESEKAQALISPDWKKLFIQKKDMSAICALLCEGDEYERDMKNAILKRAKEEVAKKTPDLTIGRAIHRLVETTDKKRSGLFKGELEKAAEICYGIFENIDGYRADTFYNEVTKESIKKLFFPGYSIKFKELAKKKTSQAFKRIIEIFDETI